MPLFNSGARVRRAIEHLLEQTFADFVLIISDNASTDDTQHICEMYAACDTRIQYIRQSRNIGQGANFDFLVHQAQTPYFMFAHDDDLHSPTFLERMVSELEKYPDAGLAMCAFQRVMVTGDVVELIRWRGSANPSQMSALKLAFSVVSESTNKHRYQYLLFGLFRTEFIQKASPYSRRLVPHLDRIYIVQFSLASPIAYVDELLFEKGVHELAYYSRIPEEQSNKLHLTDPWAYSKTVCSLVPSIVHSGIVPLRYKFLSPAFALVMAWRYRQALYRGDSPLFNFIKVPYRVLRSIGVVIFRHNRSEK